MRRSLVAALVVASSFASSFGCSTTHTEAPDHSYRNRNREDLELVLTERDGERHVRLADVSTDRQRRYAVVSTEPAQETEPVWVFELLEPDVALVWSGKTIEHPDRAVLTTLGASLEQRPPDVENCVASLSQLIRYESRGRILGQAAGTGGLTQGQTDALLDAVLATGERGIAVRATSGRVAGGKDGEARHAALVPLASRADLGEKRAQRIASSLSTLTYSWWRDEVLGPLIPWLSTEDVIAASDALDRDERHRVIERLTKERGDRRPDALEIVKTLPSLPYSWWRNDIVVKLVPVFSTHELLKLSEQLDRDERHQLIQRLVKERGGKRDEALLLLATCPSLPYSWWRNEIVLSLYPVLTTPELIKAGDDLLDRDERRQLVTRLVKDRGQTRDQAHLLCAAAASYPYTWWKNEVYCAFFDLLTTKELLDLSEQIDKDERRTLIMRLVKARGENVADAHLLRDAAASFAYSWWKNEVYTALFPVLTTGELLEVSKQLSADEAHSLYKRIVSERGARTEDAEVVAQVAPSLTQSWVRREFLELLLEKDGISTTTLLARATDLSSDDLHGLLVKVSRARRTKEGVADKIAAAAARVQNDGQKSELLLDLVGYASRNAIVAASREIRDAAEKTKVLEALVKSSPAEGSDSKDF